MKSQSSEGWWTGFQQSDLDEFADRYVTYPISTCKKGWGLKVGPAIVLSRDADPVAIAKAVYSSLEQSSDVWPPPGELNEDQKPLFDAMGITSWREYDPIALIGINRKLDSGIIRLCPMKRDGAGHSAVGKHSIRIPANASLEVVAAKIMKALSISAAQYRPKSYRKR